MRVPGDGVSDTTEPVRAGGLQRFQHWSDPIPQLQVSMADDSCSRPARAIQAAGAGRGQPLDKLDLSNRPHLHRSVGAVHSSCLDKDRKTDVMSAINVSNQFVKKISLVRDALRSKVPEMMMRVADWNLRLQWGFLS